MRDSTKNRVEGTFHEMKGNVKAAVGKTFNSPKVAIEGHAERIAGKIQEKFGKVEKIIGR